MSDKKVLELTNDEYWLIHSSLSSALNSNQRDLSLCGSLSDPEVVLIFEANIKKLDALVSSFCVFGQVGGITCNK